MERLTLVLIVSTVIGLAIFFTVIIPPSQSLNELEKFQNQVAPTQSSPRPINSFQNPISPLSLIDSYALNETIATSEYSGRIAYLTALVGNVEPSPSGSYDSCVQSSSLGQYLVYGCQSTGGGGWIIWNWENQTVAQSVPTSSNFIAECTIVGYEDANLILDTCLVAGN